MKKKNVISKNYLEKRPLRSPYITWNTDEKGIVTLEIENNGMFNKIAQKLFKKPKITYVHLDEMGSFLWPLMDGEKDVIALGEMVDEHFGDSAKPLYERLAKFIQILESYHFIILND